MTSTPPPPPPRRSAAATGTHTPPIVEDTWKSRMKAKSSVWGKKAMDTGMRISDNVGGKVNGVAESRLGVEAFWPTTGDFPKEMDKCARILRSFTVDGIVTQEKVSTNKAMKKGKSVVKVIRKIPPKVIAEASGLAIFTSMRSGFAPLGGAGGAGVVVAKLPDGTWSAPASISPNNLSTGFLIGVDVYDAVLVIRTQKALDSFAGHKATLGTEIGVAAGPYGMGAAIEGGFEKSPVFSYIRSKGFYAGVELVGQVFVERYDENARMYNWPGVKAGDILHGKVKVPFEAANLQQALKDAESGKAQKEKGDFLDMVVEDNGENLDLQEGVSLVVNCRAQKRNLAESSVRRS
ncbi:SH3 domain-containing YSC84-like protein 1, partial [Tremellales sp. Uapishka_1]